MSKRKKDKKQQKKQKQLEQVKSSHQVFDVIEILNSQKLDTKPNVTKFLNQYVGCITAVVSTGKVQCYPKIKYALSKVFVKFLDGHELVWYVKNEIPHSQSFFLYFGIDEEKLSADGMLAAESLFNALVQFKFVKCES